MDVPPGSESPSEEIVRLLLAEKGRLLAFLEERVGSRADAEDLLQIAMLRVVTPLGGGWNWEWAVHEGEPVDGILEHTLNHEHVATLVYQFWDGRGGRSDLRRWIGGELSRNCGQFRGSWAGGQ